MLARDFVQVLHVGPTECVSIDTPSQTVWTVCDGCYRRARAHLLQSLAGQLEHAGLLGGLQVGLEGAVPHGVLPMTRLAATRLLRSSRAHPLKSLQVVKRRDSLSTTRNNQEQPGTSSSRRGSAASRSGTAASSTPQRCCHGAGSTPPTTTE